MPEKISSREQLHNRNRNLWQFVFLLAVLVLVTVILVAACLYPFIHHSDYEINLYHGLVSSSQNSATASGGTSTLTGKQAKVFDFKVSDEENVWSTDTSIELFQTSYQNADGEITVQSADSKSIVAPGTSGEYTFSIQNASTQNFNYQIWLEADVSVSSSGIPIQFRLAGTDGWVDGEGKWLSAEELNKDTERKNLYSGKSTEYTLYWRWAFDQNTDDQDTSYGNFSISQGGASVGELDVSQAVSYKVTLHTLAAEGLIKENNTETPTAAPNPATVTPAQNEDTGTASDKPQAESKNTGTISEATKTGDNIPVLNWILLLVIAGAAVIVTGYCRRKER